MNIIIIKHGEGCERAESSLKFTVQLCRSIILISEKELLEICKAIAMQQFRYMSNIARYIQRQSKTRPRRFQAAVSRMTQRIARYAGV